MKDRAAMAKESRATLIHEWDQDKERYRLLAVGKWTAGYEDEYLIEHLTADGLGEPCWLPCGYGSLKPQKNEATYQLIGAIKSLLSRIA